MKLLEYQNGSTSVLTETTVAAVYEDNRIIHYS